MQDKNLQFRILIDLEFIDGSIESHEVIEIPRMPERQAFDFYNKIICGFDNVEYREYVGFTTKELSFLFELRKYDIKEKDYLDWDMTESKYYKPLYDDKGLVS